MKTQFTCSETSLFLGVDGAGQKEALFFISMLINCLLLFSFLFMGITVLLNYPPCPLSSFRSILVLFVSRAAPLRMKGMGREAFADIYRYLLLDGICLPPLSLPASLH